MLKMSSGPEARAFLQTQKDEDPVPVPDAGQGASAAPGAAIR